MKRERVGKMESKPAMQRFEFAAPGRLLAGPGVRAEVGTLVRSFGSRPALVTGTDPGRDSWLPDVLRAAGMEVRSVRTGGEPRLEWLIETAGVLRREGCDCLVGCGGGSAIDAAKALAAFVTNAADPMNYLEVVGLGQPLASLPLPVIAIPTTAGTGAEATRNAVIGVPAQRIKVSLRHPALLPRVAIVDPELTCDLPRSIALRSGMDALTQLIEAFVSLRASPMTDALCRAGIPMAMRALPQVCRSSREVPLEARFEMMLAAHWSGLALAHAGLGAVHGIAGPLGGMYEIPHGALCAALLVPVLRGNLRALRQSGAESPAHQRFTELGSLLTGCDRATSEDGIRAVAALCGDLGVPSLGIWNLPKDEWPIVVEKARASSSMKSNPFGLNRAELESILDDACTGPA